jgi:RNA polymerase sigma-70 factor, ECF subfamily
MNEESLREMMEINHTSAFGWALYCCNGDREEAAEVLHSVYVQILEKGGRAFKGKSSFKTWLFSVIRNTSKRRRFQFNLRLKKLQDLIFRPPADVKGMEDRIHENEARAGIMKLLEKLSRQQRQVLQLVFYHDLTIEEAAVVMEVSLGSARTHYDRGKSKLRAEMRTGGWNNE